MWFTQWVLATKGQALPVVAGWLTGHGVSRHVLRVVDHPMICFLKIKKQGQDIYIEVVIQKSLRMCAADR